MASIGQRVMFIFPGQGAQYPGIGSDLYRDFASARDIYSRASETLGYDIAELSFKDPAEQINLTRYTQPVLLTHSMACLEVFNELTDGTVSPSVAGGHSLGEYSALVASGALSFEDGLRLVQQRGDLMGTYGEGEMLAFPLQLQEIQPLVEEHYCSIAGCNLPDQTVVGGHRDDLEALARTAQESFPRKRSTRLKTEGAFHTYYMVTAAQKFRPVLDTCSVNTPSMRVLSNYTGGYHDLTPNSIKSRLFYQLFHPVQWVANLQKAIGHGIDTFIEFGGGIGAAADPSSKKPNLGSIVKKTLRYTGHQADYLAAINSESLETTAKIFSLKAA